MQTQTSSGQTHLDLGDMSVILRPEHRERPPAKFLKALAAISTGLHHSFDSLGLHPVGYSKTACILTSLTVREFLVDVGFADAQVYPVVCLMQARKGGRFLHSLGVGVPDDQAAIIDMANARAGYPPTRLTTPPLARRGWNGHMVVCSPSAGYLIDTTLFQAQRPQWKFLPGMFAVPYDPLDIKPIHGRTRSLAGQNLSHDDYEFGIVWLDNPGNKAWRDGGDYRERPRRVRAVEALRILFGEWREGDQSDGEGTKINN